jgi:RHS repeat-associated protein
VISGTDPNRYKFTGKERDPESGLDDFNARFYSSPFGRFMTPDWEAKPTDVPYANFGNPQSLNLYSYVQNNPTTMGDPDGHDTLEGTAIQIGLFIVNEAPKVEAAATNLGPKLLAVGGKSLGVVGVLLQRCGFPVEARSAFIKPSILRPWT